MSITDPIADLLTCIRNGLRAKFSHVEVPLSKEKVKILSILKKEGFILDYEVEEQKNRKIAKVLLKYAKNGSPVIHEIKRISKPGKRIYIQKQEIPRVKNGYGILIISTNKDVMTGAEARKANVGGEVLCEVW